MLIQSDSRLASPQFAFLPPSQERFRILVVDDDDINRMLTRDLLLTRGYEVECASNAGEARELVFARPPDLVLLDIMMPGKSGIEFCRNLKENPATRLIPLILLTGLTEPEFKLRGINAGADDFLNKPVNTQELFARVRSLLRLKQFTDELEHAESVLNALAFSVEARDPYTQGHCDRLSHGAVIMGKHLQLPESDLVALRRAGVLHDIGKITISDSILKKQDTLSPQEWDIMCSHPAAGERICQPMRSSLGRVLPIIRHHHEHWNGTGYPDRLAKDDIPQLARILQIVDCYDALTTARPYKPALTPDSAEAIMREETQLGRWDPDLVPIFFDILHQGLLPDFPA